MTPRPDLIAFDVNETLSDMAPFRAQWEPVGAPAHLAAQWFAEVLRDGFALAATGRAEPFGVLARVTAIRLLREAGVEDLERATESVLATFGELEVHPDVPEGIRRLAGLGIRLVTLSNGATGVAAGLLGRAGLRGSFEAILSVEDAARWKPAPEAYRYALTRCAVPAERAMLVAVHPWDIDGAARVGMRTAYLARSGEPYPDFFIAPELVVDSLVDLADKLAQE